MKKTLLFTLFSLLISVSALAQFESAPAFPGAEGHGRFVTGGRGGEVYHVTTLKDGGEGSLRSACESTYPLIIVFDVAGYIDLTRDLTIKSNKTILGQTAPGDGITLRYYTVKFEGYDNIIVRFLRFRRSQIKDINDGADAAWDRKSKNVIIDHCSLSWSIDELGSFYDNQNFTLQWCCLAEALRNPGHSKGEHSYGGIWGGKSVSFHHNLIAHVQNRAPRFNGARYNWTGYDGYSDTNNPVEAERVDFRNCVMYNWGTGNGCYGGPGGGYVNIVNNYYKAGPATSNKTRTTQISVLGSGGSGEYSGYSGMTSRYYIKGNYVSAAGSNAENYDWKGVKYDLTSYKLNNEYYTPDNNGYYAGEHTDIGGKSCVRIKLDSPVNSGYVTTHNATTALEKVLAFCGASLHRDDCDIRYADEALNGKTTYKGTISTTGDGKEITKLAGIIDLINDPTKSPNLIMASYPILDEGTPIIDLDNDGMPDSWEVINDLNPNDPSDAKTFSLDSEGYYTNIEVYANSLVEDLVKAENEDAESSFAEYFPAIVSSIKTVNASSGNYSPRYYNIMGQETSRNSKGIIICNGHKFINK